MKKPATTILGLMILTFGVMLFVARYAYAAGGPTAATQIIVTNTSTSATVRLAPAGTQCQSATLVGNYQPQINNSGNVYIGVQTNNGAQPIQITPGQVLVLKAPPGEWIDLHDWSLDVATPNDGLVITYTP